MPGNRPFGVSINYGLKMAKRGQNSTLTIPLSIQAVEFHLFPLSFMVI